MGQGAGQEKERLEVGYLEQYCGVGLTQRGWWGRWGGGGKKRVLAIPNLPGVFPPVSIASDK